MANPITAELVSVIIPVYNRQAMAITAVRSVIAQRYSSIDLIVVDDGSDDEPVELRAIVESVGGRFVRTAHRGVSAARNCGIAMARGGWIALLDSDDRWLPEKLSTQMDFLLANPEIKICQVAEIWFRGGVFVNPKQRHIMPNGEAFYRCLELCCISASSVVLDKALFEVFGVFREELPICEDYDLWLRLTASHHIASLEQGLVEKYGARDDQLSRSQSAQDRFRVYSILCLLRDSVLQPAKFTAALAMLHQKADVLRGGASKRSEHERVVLYTAIVEFALLQKESIQQQAVLGDLISRMGAEISKVIV